MPLGKTVLRPARTHLAPSALLAPPHLETDVPVAVEACLQDKRRHLLSGSRTSLNCFNSYKQKVLHLAQAAENSEHLSRRPLSLIVFCSSRSQRNVRAMLPYHPRYISADLVFGPVLRFDKPRPLMTCSWGLALFTATPLQPANRPVYVGQLDKIIRSVPGGMTDAIKPSLRLPEHHHSPPVLVSFHANGPEDTRAGRLLGLTAV